MLPLFSTNALPDAPGCRLPFGLGFLAFVALVVLSLMVGFAALSLLLGGLTPEANPPVQPGAHAPDEVPYISPRYIDSGSSHAAVTGAMSYSGDLAADQIRSYVDDEGLAWLAFGGEPTGPDGEPGPAVLVTFNEPEDAVTVAVGTRRATGQDDACVFDIQVTATLVSGHISCASVDVYDGDEVIGTSSIELDFTAGSPPGGGVETDAPDQ